MTKFHELRDKRLSVALSKIKLLGNLGRPSYGSLEAERRAIVVELERALAGLRRAYKLATPPHTSVAPPPPPRPSGVPSGTAQGGASFEAEVRWAIDAIRRGDTKLAENRLRRCLTNETN
jgi:hypothetical protein